MRRSTYGTTYLGCAARKMDEIFADPYSLWPEDLVQMCGLEQGANPYNSVHAFAG